MPKMARFTLSPRGEGYALVIECEDSYAIEILTSFDQLDDLAEAIDQQLDADDNALPHLPALGQE